MIETERLYIRPLPYAQLLKYSLADRSLEQELNVKALPAELSPDLKEALETSILTNVAGAGSDYLYFTLWNIVLKSRREMVGDLCLMGRPDAKGTIEIGYGIHEAFRGYGYMAEAIAGLIGWAAGRPEIRAICASTEKDNLASQKVLTNNGFLLQSASGTLLNWRLELKSVASGPIKTSGPDPAVSGEL
ncbi:GNAT family N-acetyltransferase [Lentimicrobium sp.]|jgi:RimJ/RimL family protein N-acetyltransferase|uniref:GNAT family N-acetyltransferase n=1 Tax=Lentimicrobium sp. TaxID=2034841 RepID=UPI002CD2EA4A|nr:GNAT family N-acetyltransferase [Lentimicrobium sp.]HPF64646.1 GNAT family N-acetyltransferase [Lentimicrobium sp.]HPR25901.1 GNAT family N-acetyltransferase [Lentimicrobium sp.]